MGKARLLIPACLSLLVAGALGAKWHEDPRDDLVRNVFFTNKLTDWTATGSGKLKIETVGRYVYRLDVTASSGGSSSSYGVGQTITVQPETWYRLEARGSAGKKGQAALFATATSGSLIGPGAQASLATGTITSRHSDFFVPKGVTKVRVGVAGVKPARGDKFSLSHVSVRKFGYSWLSNSSFRGGSAGGWHPLNHATITKKKLTYFVKATASGTDTSGPAGISQRHVGVLPGRRYRIVTRGFRAKGVKAMAFPRVYRSNDDGFVAGPNSLASAGASLPAGGRMGTVFFDFTVPEGVDRLTVAVAFVSAGSLPNVRKGDSFEVESISMYLLPNQLVNGDLDMGVKPWTANGKTAVAASTDAGDRSLTATVKTSVGTPGIRIDNVPVVPGTRYHYEAIARTASKGHAYLWVQEPNGEDLHWVYRNGFPPAPDAKVRGIDFIAPRNVKSVNIGVLFSPHPTKFAAGDKIIVHSASLTGVGMPATFQVGRFYAELVGRYPTPPTRPTPPPPPPPVVIKAPVPAKPVAPPAWESILNTKQAAALTDNVEPAVENTYKVHPECRDPKMAWLAKIHPEDVDTCSTECETKFYNKGAAGDHTPYADYRMCFDCCIDMVEQFDGVRATGTAGKSWVPLSPKMFDSQFVKNFAMTYMADEDGKVTIKGTSTARGCGKGPGSGWVLFINGGWTRIQYTEHFRGTASCNGVFGSMAYHYLPSTVTNGLMPFSSRAGDAVYDTHRMGGMDVHEFDGRTRRCDNDKDNWWHQINGKGERRATVNLRRDPEATRAGISTGVSCSNNAVFEISDVYLWM